MTRPKKKEYLGKCKCGCGEELWGVRHRKFLNDQHRMTYHNKRREKLIELGKQMIGGQI
jgi:hypothetical protein